MGVSISNIPQLQYLLVENMTLVLAHELLILLVLLPRCLSDFLPWRSFEWLDIRLDVKIHCFDGTYASWCPLI